MNVEKILTEVYWDLSPLNDDQIKYPDHDTLRKQLKKYLNSRYGTIIAKEVNNEESKKHTFIFSEPVYVKEGEVIKEVNMAGILNAQVQEWYKNNVDLLSVIDKLTKRCEKLEEENTHLKDEVKAAVSREEIARWNLENRTHEVIELDRCLDEKNAKNKELRCKVTDLECRIRQLRKKVEELQASYDNCVNECSDHVIEIDSLLQNLEVKTIEEALDKIRLIKRDGVFITRDFDSELRVENERLKRKIEDLRKDVQFEFNRRMEALAARVDQDAKIAELKETIKELRQKNYDLSRVLQEETIGKKRAESENDKLKSFIKDRTKYLHDMTEAIEKHLAELREEKNNE